MEYTDLLYQKNYLRISFAQPQHWSAASILKLALFATFWQFLDNSRLNKMFFCYIVMAIVHLVLNAIVRFNWAPCVQYLRCGFWWHGPSWDLGAGVRWRRIKTRERMNSRITTAKRGGNRRKRFISLRNALYPTYPMFASCVCRTWRLRRIEVSSHQPEGHHGMPSPAWNLW
jgi:hypothetical protein